MRTAPAKNTVVERKRPARLDNPAQFLADDFDDEDIQSAVDELAPMALEDYRDKQIARKTKCRSGDSAEKTKPAVDNGRPRASRNGQRSTHQKSGTPSKKQGSNGHSSEMPQCLLDRMTPPTHDASQPAAATAANGRA